MATPVIRSVSHVISDVAPTATTPTGAGVTPQAGDTVLIFDGSDFYTLAAMSTPSNTGGITLASAHASASADAGLNGAHIKTWIGAVVSTGAFSVTAVRTGSGDEDKALSVYVFAGTVTVTAAVNAAGGSTPGYTMPTLTAGAADDMIVSSVASGTGASTASYTTSLTTLDYSDRVGSMSAAAAHEQLSASGATGTRTWTPASSTPYALVGVIVNSAGGGTNVDSNAPAAPAVRLSGSLATATADTLASAPGAPASRLSGSAASAAADTLVTAPGAAAARLSGSTAVADVEAPPPGAPAVRATGSGAVVAAEAAPPGGAAPRLSGSPAVVAVEVVAPGAPAARLAGSAASTAADLFATDPGGAAVRAHGTDATAASVVQVDAPGAPAVRAHGSAAAAVADVLTTAPGAPAARLSGSGAAGSGDFMALAPAAPAARVFGSAATAVSAVDVQATAPGAPAPRLHGSSATVGSTEVVHDQMVMPILTLALSCLNTETAKLEFPPKYLQLRPGATFTAMVDSKNDECCEGIGWVRPGPMFPTDSFPEPRGDSVPWPMTYFAVSLEFGILRCVDTIGPGGGDPIVTGAQWLAMTQRWADDAAALRRVICCVQDHYGDSAVIAGQITPLENEGNCGGQTVILTVRAPVCDCQDAG